jgi:hypothetical protein
LKRDFEKYYNEKLLPTLLILEKRRQKNKKLAIALTGISALLTLVLTFIFSKEHFPFYLVGSFIVSILIFALKKENIKDDFKNVIVAKLVKYIDESLTFSHREHITQQEYMASMLFTRRPDRYKGDDLVQGVLGKTNIRFSELHSEYKTTTKTKNGTQTHWHTIFKGIFIVADFHKDFKFRTLILPDTAEAIFGRFGRKLQKMSAPLGSLVQLEDIEFEKHFVVYSEDQVEARYLISTSMMQRILDYKKKWNKKIYLSLIDSKLYLAVYINKDMFEPKFFSSLLGIKNYEEMLGYLNLIIDVVEDLNLNTRIWTKE